MSESYNQYGLGPTTLCAHGLPNLDTRCPYCERDALRAEVERLKERLDRIDAFAGERCEASGCRPDPCGPVEYHDVEGVPLCAECWQECLDEAAEREERGKEKGNG